MSQFFLWNAKDLDTPGLVINPLLNIFKQQIGKQFYRDYPYITSTINILIYFYTFVYASIRQPILLL